ncbi:DUF4468 domain-containing protein [Rufibacter latericius]|uniref:DUF4468 domain-containing protein n=1 Tax=Rufibacter latericius TaxID=2487040 RepID=UPI001404098F|nr:DUF4468 domain-containing protein [Rufibacter latericius]
MAIITYGNKQLPTGSTTDNSIQNSLKRLLSFLFLLLPILVAVQTVKFKHTGKAPKASREDLQVLADDFVQNYYKALQGHQKNTSEGEVVVRNAIQKITVESNGMFKPVLFEYDLKISLQEGRYSAEVTNTTFTMGNQPIPGERFLGPTPPDDKKDDVEFLSTMSSYQQQTRAFVESLFKELDKVLKSK